MAEKGDWTSDQSPFSLGLWLLDTESQETENGV